jgi:RNA 3'-terminal phosphate cyclase
MEKGLADPHEEARRMTEPCVQVDKEEARRMGIEVDVSGRVSRSTAEGMWKNMSSLLGDTAPNPNAEMLRSDRGRSKGNSMVVPVNIENGKVIHGE